jgi:hypothetical protein
MNDNELERTLRLYRPVGPPPALRSRVVSHRDGRVIPASAWMPTAAALLAAVALYWLSAHERAVVRVNLDQAAVARAATIELVSRSLGGGTQSRLAAEFVVLLDEPKTQEPGR